MPFKDKLSNIIDWVSNTAGDFYDNTLDTPVKGIGKLVEVVGRPGRSISAFAGAPRGENLDYVKKVMTGEYKDTDWDWVLGQKFGMEPGALRSIAGFTGDIVTDPLNFVGPVAKAAEVYPLMRKAVLGGLRSNKIGKDVLNAFSKYESLPEPLRNPARLLGSELAHQPHTVETRIKNIYDEATKLAGRKLTPQEREAATRILATGEWSVPEGADEKTLKYITTEGRKYLDELFANETAAGVMAKEGKIKDYFPHLIRRSDAQADDVLKSIRSVVNPKNPHAMKRTIKEYDRFLQVARAQGEEPITDVFEGLMQRGLKGNKAASTGKFIQSLLNDSKFADTAVNRPNWVGLTEGKFKGLPLWDQVSEKVFDPDVAKYLKSLTIAKPQTATGQAFDDAIQLFKTGATTIRPGFHLSNLKSNMWNMALGGDADNALEAFVKSPMMFGKGWKTLKGIQRGDDLGQPKLVSFLKKHGIVGGSIHTLRDIAGPKGTQKLAEVLGDKKFNPLTWPAQAGRKVGSDIEDSSKIGYFLDYMERNPNNLKGEALLNDALFATKKTMFDYSELTDIERKYLRRVLPFYTFTKKNLPVQIQGLIEKPFMTSGLGHTQRLGKNLTEAYRPEEVLREGDLPDYASESVPIQIPNFSNPGKPLTFDPYLPISDLGLLNPFDPMGTVRDLASRMLPIYKAPIELGMNRLLYSGLPIKDDDLRWMDNRFKIPGTNVTLPGKDPLKYLINSIPPGPYASKLLLDYDTDKQMTPDDIYRTIANIMSGASFKEYDWDKLIKSNQSEQQRENRRQSKLNKLPQ